MKTMYTIAVRATSSSGWIPRSNKAGALRSCRGHRAWRGIGTGYRHLATVFALNWLTAQARERVPWLRRLLEPEPTVVARDGAWLDDAVSAEKLDPNDLAEALRQHGLERVEDARLVVLEQDGSVSVVPRETDGEALRRRRRPARRL